jgi:hypothetical protein
MESYDLQCSLHSLFATAFWAHMDFMVQGNGCWQITRVRPRADCMSNHAIERSSFEWRHWTWNLEATRSYWQHGGRFLCRVRVGVVWTIVKSRKRIIQSLLVLGRDGNHYSREGIGFSIAQQATLVLWLVQMSEE